MEHRWGRDPHGYAHDMTRGDGEAAPAALSAEHQSGEHADIVVIDCPMCREDAAALGMGDRLYEAMSDRQLHEAEVGGDECAGVVLASRIDMLGPLGAPSHEDVQRAMLNWSEALIQYGAGAINKTMYVAVRERSMIVMERAEEAASL